MRIATQLTRDHHACGANDPPPAGVAVQIQTVGLRVGYENQLVPGRLRAERRAGRFNLGATAATCVDAIGHVRRHGRA
jgi:hypothetical protein